MGIWRRPINLKPDFVIGEEDAPYLKRWYIIPRNTRFNIYLHHFMKSDDDRALHDHPWWNVSFLLTGSYIEILPGPVAKLRKRGRLVWRRATAAHRIELLKGLDGKERPVWTLFITGRNVRTWGFHCPKGWIPFHQFIEPTRVGNKRGAGCGE
jgi:hypothetical protein